MMKTAFPPKNTGALRFTKGSENISLLTTGLALFLLNQLIEFLLITALESNYSKLCNWDCGWYSGLVRNGYDAEPHAHPKMDAANWAFFPFFPLLAKAFAFLSNASPSVALVITGKVLFLLAIFAFMKMAKEYSPNIPFLISGSMVALSPYAIYGNTGYTESAFLLFSACFFYLLKKEKWIAAALVGALLTSVRLAGIFSLFSYIVSSLKKLKNKELDMHVFLLGALLIPLGLGLFMLYLYWLTGDALAFSNIQRSWGRIPSNPIHVLWDGLQGSLFNQFAAAMSLAALLAAGLLAYKKMYDFAVFSFLCTIIPLSTGLLAMPRYIFWQAPILFLLAYFCSKNKFWVLVLPIFTTMQAVMYMGWISDKAWTI